MNIQKPRGTQDYFSCEFDERKKLEDGFVKFFGEKKYLGLETPIFEQRNLFVRTVGGETDIVQKELFDLAKKSEETYSLRPEFTAGVIRSLIEKGLKSMPQPVKVFSYGPCFRYERPQRGRKRQFNQLNIEFLGKKSAEIDTQVISELVEFLLSLGLEDLQVSLNTFGNLKTRNRYAKQLGSYLVNAKGLCELCLNRSQKNPLRALDCKNEVCQQIVKNGPSILDALDKNDKEDFDKTLSALEKTWQKKIEIVKTPQLVRGLDYYTGIVFEINLKSDQSRMSSIGGGGRYDNLVGELGGPQMPAIGYALGFDRVIEGLEK